METVKCLITIAFLASNLWCAEAHVSCYYVADATEKPGNGHFTVETIDAFLCDELIYGFAGINETSFEIQVLNPYRDLYENGGQGGYDRFTNLKNLNPDLKTTLSIGGYNEGSAKFSQMSSDAGRRSAFVTSTVQLLEAHQFDGVDINWQFPGYGGGVPEDKDNYVLLLQELDAALEARSLTVTVAHDPNIIAGGYDLQRISNSIDYFNVLTYDYHGAWENFTHHNAPLDAHPTDQNDVLVLNIEYTVDLLIQVGAPVGKIVMSVPTYGRCYTLASTGDTDFYAPATSPGYAGPYSSTPGLLGYNEICEMQTTTNDWITVLDPSMNEPYSYRLGTNIWCGYDDPQSVAVKAEYALLRNLGGLTVFSLDTDDFRGNCGGNRNFELIRTLKDVYSGQTPSTTSTGAVTETTSITSEETTTETSTPITETTTVDTTTTEETTTTTEETTTTSELTITTPETTTQSTTTEGGGGHPECGPDDVFLPHEECDKYYQCVNGVATEQDCPDGLYWNQAASVCDFPANVDTSNCIEPPVA